VISPKSVYDILCNHVPIEESATSRSLKIEIRTQDVGSVHKDSSSWSPRVLDMLYLLPLSRV
jgi:hypothetical protein